MRKAVILTLMLLFTIISNAQIPFNTGSVELDADLNKINEFRFDGNKFVDLKLPPSRIIKGWIPSKDVYWIYWTIKI